MSDLSHPVHQLAQSPYLEKIFILNQNPCQDVCSSFMEVTRNLGTHHKYEIIPTPRNNLLTQLNFIVSCISEYDYILSLDDDFIVTRESIKSAIEYQMQHAETYVGFIPRYIKTYERQNRFEYSGDAANASFHQNQEYILGEQTFKTSSYPYNMLLIGASLIKPETISIDLPEYFVDIVNLHCNYDDILANYMVQSFMLKNYSNPQLTYVHDARNHSWVNNSALKTEEYKPIAGRPNHLTKRLRFNRICKDFFGDILIKSDKVLVS